MTSPGAGRLLAISDLHVGYRENRQLWCGTSATEDWHRRFGAAAMVYGHLHIPRRIWHDGVPFDEVSLGHPREWKARPAAPSGPRQIPADRTRVERA
jgi:hypothetical protein